MVIVYEYPNAIRFVPLDGRPQAVDPDPSWMGTSVGRWDGDTLVVETVGLDERSWLDQLGRPHSDQMKVTERWRRLDRDNLELTFTLDDPKAYAKPWISDRKVLHLQAKPSPYSELREVIFAPADEQRFNTNVRNPAAGLSDPKK